MQKTHENVYTVTSLSRVIFTLVRIILHIFLVNTKYSKCR